MYKTTTDYFATASINKLSYLRSHPTAFFVQAMMAGAYVGLGIILIFSVGSAVAPEFQKLVMGVSFGVALTLVVFAGAELFTGHTMYSAFAVLKRKQTLSSTTLLWTVVWLGNLFGCITLALIYKLGGGGLTGGEGSSLLIKVAAYKTESTAMALFARGILCNWLVCLALWMSARTDSDTAKAIVIFWALYAFIASGYEHSVANMTLLSLSLMVSGGQEISYLAVAHNLLWVTLGNIIGGALFMGGAYSLGEKANPKTQADKKQSDTRRADNQSPYRAQFRQSN